MEYGILAGCGSNGNPYARVFPRDSVSEEKFMERMNDQASYIKEDANEKKETVKLVRFRLITSDPLFLLKYIDAI